jgi:outer membrane protein TolC
VLICAIPIFIESTDLKQLFELRLANGVCAGFVTILVQTQDLGLLSMFREYKTFTIFKAFCLILLPAVVLAEDTQDGLPSEPLYLSLTEVFERVKSQNLQVLIGKESVLRALEQSYQRKAALLPQFAIRAQQTRQQRARDFISAELNTPPFNSFASRIEASLSVFDTQAYADFKIAGLNEAIAARDYEVATQDILEQSVLLYFTHLSDLRALEIASANLERERSLLELATQQFEAGAVVKIDVTRTDVRVATERRAVMEAEIAVEASSLQMKALLNLDLDREIKLDRGIIEAVNAPPAIKAYGLIEALAAARPELQSQQKVLAQAELVKKAAGWQRLPAIELFANWGYDSSQAFDGEAGEAWLVGLRARVPLWEGGRIAAQKREASAALRQNEYLMRDLRNQVAREFKFSLLEMESRYAQIEVARDEMRLGQDEVEQARERYREGLGDNRELIDAQTSLANAQHSHLRAIYLYGLSRLAFARSIGSVERVLD